MTLSIGASAPLRLEHNLCSHALIAEVSNEVEGSLGVGRRPGHDGQPAVPGLIGNVVAVSGRRLLLVVAESEPAGASRNGANADVCGRKFFAETRDPRGFSQTKDRLAIRKRPRGLGAGEGSSKALKLLQKAQRVYEPRMVDERLSGRQVVVKGKQLLVLGPGLNLLLVERTSRVGGGDGIEHVIQILGALRQRRETGHCFSGRKMVGKVFRDIDEIIPGARRSQVATVFLCKSLLVSGV